MQKQTTSLKTPYNYVNKKQVQLEMNRWVLSFALNMSSEVEFLICGGRLFHSCRAACVKERCPFECSQNDGKVGE